MTSHPRLPLFCPLDSARRVWPHGALALLVLAVPLVACGGAQPLRAELPAMQMQGAAPVEHDPFGRDRSGAISEDDLERVLRTPVYLADETRLGIVPVAVAYEADDSIPLAPVPGALAEALDNTGFFTVATEVSTDWPSDTSISGLRELAARYRARYLLLYRHRFIERRRANGWSAAYLTVVAIPFVPSRTLETAGVLEATLFDAQTGAILFTVYERVHAESDENIWGNGNRLREMREHLLNEGAGRLADRVVHEVHRLVAARPAPPSDSGSASGQPDPSSLPPVAPPPGSVEATLGSP
jgi:hypothetical protein